MKEALIVNPFSREEIVDAIQTLAVRGAPAALALIALGSHDHREASLAMAVVLAAVDLGIKAMTPYRMAERGIEGAGISRSAPRRRPRC